MVTLIIKFKTLVVLSLTLLLTSCAHKIYISHNSFANVKAIPQGFPHFASFAVEPLSRQDSMLSQEIATKIEHLLEENGYIVEKEIHTQYYVLFDYHMERIEKTVHVDKYIPGQTVTSYGTVLSNGKAKIYEGQTQTPGTIISVPEIHTFFNKTLTVQVFETEDYRRNAHAKPVWQETAASCDENNDLRDSLDYLLIIAFEYFGRNTQKSLESTISSDDKEVAALRTRVFHSCKIA